MYKPLGSFEISCNKQVNKTHPLMYSACKRLSVTVSLHSRKTHQRASTKWADGTFLTSST